MQSLDLLVLLSAMFMVTSSMDLAHDRSETPQAPGGPVKPKGFRSFWNTFISSSSSSSRQDLPLRIVGGIFSMVDGILNAIIDPPMFTDTTTDPNAFESRFNFLTYSFCQFFSGLFTAGNNGEGTPCFNFTTTTIAP